MSDAAVGTEPTPESAPAPATGSPAGNPPSAARTAGRLGSPIGLYIIAAVMGGLVAALIGDAFLGQSLAALGIPDPGPVTSWGVPLVRGIGTVMACLGIGSFMMSAFGAQPRKDGYLDLDGFRASRTGTWAMAAWAVCALLLVPLYLSDASSQPLLDTLRPDMWGFAIAQVSTAKAMLWIAIIAGAVTVLSLLTRRWIWQPVFFVIAVASLVPVALEGHSASGGNHDYGVNSLLWHVVLSAIWIGGLMALVAHAARRGPFLAEITRRYSVVALFCIIGIALSGLINAGIRLSFTEWFTTDYGRVIAAKAVLTLILAAIGFAHRRSTIPQLDAPAAGAWWRRPFVRLALVEIFVMAATVGVALSLTRIPPPVEVVADITPAELIMGFDVTEPFSLVAVLTTWRFDMVFGTIALLLQGVYMWAWITVRRRGVEWRTSRVVWWTLANLVLIFVTCSGLGMYSMAMFAPHMLQHMALTMLIPVFWVLGGPMTLLLRALRPAGRDGLQGPREWLVVFINNPVSRFLTNPIVASFQFVVGFYALYLSDLFSDLAAEHAGHLFMMLHFLISGYIFYWVVIGVDAAPRQLSPFMKLLMTLASMAFHAWFGIAMMQMAQPLAESYYLSLQLPFDVDLMEQQHTGGAIAWGLSELPLLVVSTAHAVQWLRQDRKEAARYDRKAERDNDADLDEYNAMLAGLREGRDADAEAYYRTEYRGDEVQGYVHSEKAKRGQRHRDGGPGPV
ncbi:cytochrome c oxidase assembly protein [Corynebacterium kalidii]|uniref:Bifunctional copper resistance protein CopD/cytochrome c oxidase assembly protein n=1 Tax=Corynebacterium kalidii TaxID=2931982 RepID=A0A9X1WFW9_9CORY|nr:cytochrome c oxidase assembly protein [Corynebacterium kalidii]MCJ7858279.1 bifunctional copper resistance protein CopD/cytochrome c oxidase assembly protein [Corynebacterium kalidii]